MKRLGLATHFQQRGFVVRPAAVRIERDLDPILEGLKRVFEERVGTDSVRDLAAFGEQLERGGVPCRASECQRDLTARNGKRLQQIAGSRLPEEITDLVVIGLDLVRLDDASVITQAVKKLRAVGLRIDWLQLEAFDVSLLARSFGLRIDVESTRALPDARHCRQWAEVLQRMRIDVLRLGVDVGWVFIHRGRLFRRPLPKQAPATRGASS